MGAERGGSVPLRWILKGQRNQPRQPRNLQHIQWRLSVESLADLEWASRCRLLGVARLSIALHRCALVGWR